MKTESIPNTYDLAAELHEFWKKAEALYRDGNRNPDEYFDPTETEALSALGLGVMDIYDYVEDFVSLGEPDFGSFLLVTVERIFYFLDEMGGEPSRERVDADQLPPKTEAVSGIEWLPRILVKGRGKLRGELPADIMFGCGGDRKFLKSCGIHPAEFLRKIRSSNSDEEVIAWAAARKG